MIAAWIVYSLLVGALLAAGAWAADGLSRLAGRPTRWAWGAGLLLWVALTAIAPWRGPPPAPDARLPLRVEALEAGAKRAASVRERLAALLHVTRQAVASPARELLIVVERGTPRWAASAAAIAWPAASALLLALLAAVHLRYRRARQGWPRAELHGVRVRVAPATGPAVVGLLRPDIVVPRWLLRRAPEEQRLVLVHESEHARAGDALLLAAGWVAAALLPWHPASWWMLARLRLAVELDCDARVLRRGAARHSYGALLIEIAGSSGPGSSLRLGAPALADEPSQLERRLIAMTPRPVRLAPVRAASLAAIAAVALLAACEAALPTAAEVERMDAASATAGAQRMKVLSPDDSLTTYTIDGERASAEQANLLAPEEIASVEVVKRDGSGEIRITTRSAAAAAGLPLSEGTRMRLRTERSDSAGAADGVTFESKERIFTGLIFIDGVRADQAAMRALSPDAIESVEVIKGPAATQRYPEPEAANGVIRITTKR